MVRLHKLTFIIAVALSFTIMSCNLSETITPSAESDVAEKFANEFFNLRYKNSAKYCTKESEQWLKFAASQIGEEDLAVLRNAEDGATVEIENVESGETESKVTVRVSNYFEADTIGKPGRIADEGLFRLSLVKENRTWKVRMEGLPRSEKRSRD
ncbi:MAG: hypothetical protein SOZ80_01240 [Prevotella sp.]|uniref:hypothetical protein n=1 Tax=Prevotella sp. TaxID=59823 RepID=UPI002A2F80EA|nr:hypothetical protein [Prevotella sp.]MDD7318652.1 hypothetical protein [Prevotellaceae bacterium]MDY4019392.1 hypothetical protein [Prevotella sp.]